jgi:hypothetical protein
MRFLYFQKFIKSDSEVKSFFWMVLGAGQESRIVHNNQNTQYIHYLVHCFTNILHICSTLEVVLADYYAKTNNHKMMIIITTMNLCFLDNSIILCTKNIMMIINNNKFDFTKMITIQW